MGFRGVKGVRVEARLQGSGFRVQVQGVRLRVWGLGLWVCGVLGFGCVVGGLSVRARCFGLSVSHLRTWGQRDSSGLLSSSLVLFKNFLSDHHLPKGGRGFRVEGLGFRF